jgi:predicted transcriptional regulator
MGHGDVTMGEQTSERASGKDSRTLRRTSGADHRDHEQVMRRPTRSLPAPRLGPLDLAIIHGLLYLPLLGVPDLALFLQVSDSAIYRHIHNLEELGLVEIVTPSFIGVRNARLACLTPAGLRVAGQVIGADSQGMRSEAALWGADLVGLARLMPRLPALITVQQLLPDLLTTCIATVVQHLTSSALRSARSSVPFRQGDCDSRSRNTGQVPVIHWRWCRQYRHTFEYRHQRDRLWVDALVSIHVRSDSPASAATGTVSAGSTLPDAQERHIPSEGSELSSYDGKMYALWILLDPGIGDVSMLAPRLGALLRYRESAERWYHSSHYASFPPVLVLTSSNHRAGLWREVGSEQAERLRVKPLVGLIQVTTPSAGVAWPIAVPGSTAWADCPPEPIARSGTSRQNVNSEWNVRSARRSIDVNAHAPSSEHYAASDQSPNQSRWIDLLTGVPASLGALFSNPVPEEALPPGLLDLPLAPFPVLLSASGSRSEGKTYSSANLAHGHARQMLDVQQPMGGQHRHEKKHSQGKKSDGNRLRRASERRILAVAQICLKFNRTDLCLLATLAAHPLLCLDDLAVFLLLHVSTVERRLRTLRRLGMVERRSLPAAVLSIPYPFSSQGRSSAAIASTNSGPEQPLAFDTGNTATCFRLTRSGWYVLAQVYRLPLLPTSAFPNFARNEEYGGRSPVAPNTERMPTPEKSEPCVPAQPTSKNMVADRNMTESVKSVQPAQKTWPLPGAQLLRTPQHTSGLYRFFALLHAAQSPVDAPADDVYRLLWWETGRSCYRRFCFNQHWYALCPDGIGECLWGRRRIRFWLEWDAGTMNSRDLRQKFATYALYASLAQAGLVRTEEFPAVPLVLVVVASYGQERRVRRILQELLDEKLLFRPYPFSLRITTADRIAGSGILAPIWLPLVPPIQLSPLRNLSGDPRSAPAPVSNDMEASANWQPDQPQERYADYERAVQPYLVSVASNVPTWRTRE